MPLNKLKEHNVGYRAWPKSFDPQRPTILMIHGAGGRSEVWNAQIRPLGRNFNAIAIDLPGHGNTSRNDLADISAYAQWLTQVTEACFETPVVLMGHSMGGAICQKVALQRPDLIKALILVGTAPRLKVAPVFLEGLKKNFSDTVDAIMKYAYSSSAPPIMLNQGAQLMKEVGQKALYNDFAACDRFDVRNEIHNIDLPTLIICGEEDKLTPPSLCKKLQEKIKQSKITIIPAAGHMVMIEAHRPFNEAVSIFITS
ncbi:MAG: alpha/beta hydrolase [Deltaproteobacteria bacterium]|nr:alpha/beta hydrolase [Deltaproteobacteria bacterium]MBW1927842.1 alpha/beta hydrolase [Deltaproteobacteria bacterium]MBW2026221.1 alpha/beta hydrolase [Deltaproteobacteria bacterium]MBW2125228.1 alpha/beta hydrolase [Deltaproteobacteria bacterium]